MIALAESDVHIWYRSTELLDAESVRLAGENLSIEECARRDRLYFEADRRDFSIAHDLLRRALSRYADILPSKWRFATSAHGKPSIDSADARIRALTFNLSHTRGCVACAISWNAPLGVDVERTDRSVHVHEIADRYFSKKEAAWLRQCSEEKLHLRFAELWTLKEAFLKAVGVGWHGALDCLSFRLSGHSGIEFFPPENVAPQQWHFALFEPAQASRLGLAVRTVARPNILMREDDVCGRTLAPLRVSA